MHSRKSHLLVALLLTTGLFAQVGLLRAPQLALVTCRAYADPTPEDADPADDTAPENGAEREEEATRGEAGLVASLLPSARRGVLGFLSLPANPAPLTVRALRFRPDAGHFLAAGRELRNWIQSQRC